MRATISILILTSVIIACSDAVERVSNNNLKPTARMGNDLNNIPKRAAVILDGSNSSDPENSQLTYHWRQVSGIPVTIENPNKPIITIYTPNQQDTIKFGLIVKDTKNMSSEETFISVTVINQDPVANAGKDFTINSGTSAELNGSGSYDIDNDDLKYRWTYLGTLSGVTINDVTIVNPVITLPDAPGEIFIFELKLIDEDEAVAIATVSISIAGGGSSVPVANAGQDIINVAVGERVTLDGSLSKDPAQLSLSYQWKQVDGPSISLSSPTIAQPDFTFSKNLINRRLVFQLVVSNGTELSVADEVTILTVSNPDNNITLNKNPFQYGARLIDFPMNFGASAPVFKGMVLSGDYLYAAVENYGVLTLETSNPTRFSLVADVNLSASNFTTTNDIAKVDNTLVVAQNDFTLLLIDVQNPTSPGIPQPYAITGAPKAIKVVGNTAYVAMDTAGLLILDLSNPTQPLELGSYNTPGNALDLAVDGDIVFIADGSSVQILDVSIPTAVKLLGSYSANQAHKIAIQKPLAFVGQVAAESLALNVEALYAKPSIPTTPALQFTINVNANDIAVLDNYVVIVDSSGDGAVLIDMAKGLSQTSYDMYRAHAVEVFGTEVYVGSYRGVQMFNPLRSSPTLGQLPISESADVASIGNQVYVASKSGFQRIDVSNKRQPSITHQFNTPGSAVQIELMNNYAYVYTSVPDTSILTFDISQSIIPDPLVLDLLDISFGWAGQDPIEMLAVNSKLFVADYVAGLQVFEALPGTVPVMSGSYGELFEPHAIAMTNSTVHVGHRTGISHINTSDPTNPTLLSTTPNSYTIRGILMNGNNTILATSASSTPPDGGLEFYNFNPPNTLNLQTSFATRGGANSLISANGLTYLGEYDTSVSDGMGGIKIFNTSDPTSVILEGGFFDPKFRLPRLNVSGQDIFVADFFTGFYVIPDAALNLTRKTDITGNPYNRIIEYSVSWPDYQTQPDLACETNFGGCVLTSVNFSNSQANFTWSTPANPGKLMELKIFIGNYHYFLSTKDVF